MLWRLSQESRQTRELQQKIRVESDLVVLTVTVKDDQGKLVSGLVKDDFHVFDDEVEQHILSFTDESLPLSLLILVDDDMKWKDGNALARSVRSVIGDIADQDEAMVCRYDMLFYRGDEFTNDSTKLMADLKSAQSKSLPSRPYIPGTVMTDSSTTAGPPAISAPVYAGSRASEALDDALYSSAEILGQQPRDRRRIILMFTDAVNEPKLNHHTHEAVRDLLLQAQYFCLCASAGIREIETEICKFDGLHFEDWGRDFLRDFDVHGGAHVNAHDGAGTA